MTQTPIRDWFVAVHVNASSLLDEGVEPTLALFQEAASANAVMVCAHGFNPEVIDRPERHAGHGAKRPHRSAGGSFFTPHPEFYQGLELGSARVREPMFEGFDVLAETLPVARARGMSTYLYILESAGTGGRQRNIAGFPSLLEIDALGRRAALPCINHPTYRAWKLALIEDLYKSYEFDGLHWGVERWGPIHVALNGQVPTCFCEHCGAAAGDAGLDWQRTVDGFVALHGALPRWRAKAEGGKPPFIDFLRILLEYPEIVAWERTWNRSYLSLHRELYGVAKWLAPDRQFGLGLWHYFFINPLLRAEWDLRDFARSCDFIRPILYHLPEGARIRHYLDALTAGPFQDVPPSDLMAGFCRVLGLELPPLADVAAAGLPASYVEQGVRAVRREVGKEMPIYAGIGIDVPERGLEREMTPDDVVQAVQAAARAGADGVSVSRNYAEMRLENLKAVGQAVRALGR